MLSVLHIQSSHMGTRCTRRLLYSTLCILLSQGDRQPLKRDILKLLFTVGQFVITFRDKMLFHAKSLPEWQIHSYLCNWDFLLSSATLLTFSLCNLLKGKAYLTHHRKTQKKNCIPDKILVNETLQISGFQQCNTRLWVIGLDLAQQPTFLLHTAVGTLKSHFWESRDPPEESEMTDRGLEWGRNLWNGRAHLEPSHNAILSEHISSVVFNQCTAAH